MCNHPVVTNLGPMAICVVMVELIMKGKACLVACGDACASLGLCAQGCGWGSSWIEGDFRPGVGHECCMQVHKKSEEHGAPCCVHSE